MFIFLGYKQGVFWLNMVKFEVNLRYRYCSNLFREMRKDSEFRQHRCQNSTKVGERKRKSGREKFLIFGNTITEISSAHTCCPSEYAQGKGIAEIGGEIFYFFSLLFRQCHCHISLFFFFFFKKWYVHTIFTIFLQQILSDRLLLLD